jgi:hypothetical protein
MKKALIVLICLIFTLASFTGAFAKTKWDLHLNYPAGNFHSKGAQQFADKVKQATNGELSIVLHPGAALGFKGPELLRAVAEGQLVIAEVPTGMVEGDAPTLALTAQPFISTNAFEQRLLYQLAKPTYAKILKKFNQFTLYSSVWPFSGIYTQRAVKTESDLKGLKMRVYDGTGLAFGKATGIAARKMPFSEVYPAMKAGLLDSMYTSSVSGVDAKAWEVLTLPGTNFPKTSRKRCLKLPLKWKTICGTWPETWTVIVEQSLLETAWSSIPSVMNSAANWMRLERNCAPHGPKRRVPTPKRSWTNMTGSPDGSRKPLISYK